MKRKDMYSVIRNDAQYRQAVLKHNELTEKGMRLERDIAQLRGYLNFNQDNRKVMKDYRNMCSDYQSVLMEARMLESKMQQYLLLINSKQNGGVSPKVSLAYRQRN